MIGVRIRFGDGSFIDDDWTEEKLAFFILSCDIDRPKYRKALCVDWVPLRGIEVMWDKAKLSEEEFDRLSATWPRDEPRAMRHEQLELIRLSAQLEKTSLSCGLYRTDEPHLFAEIIASVGVNIKYDRFDYLQGHTWFTAPCRAEFILRVLEVYGVPATDYLASGRPVSCEAALAERNDFGWSPPFNYGWQE